MSDTKYPTPTLENIASLENLYMAWNRLAKSITYSDVWYDEYEFSKFECLLDHIINEIHKALIDGSYDMDSIRPIPFPKGGRDDSGNLKVRQAFWIPMKDQLVWVAICNVLGPLIETKMPGWSTGNRLYVPMWKENVDENSQWQYGSFLNCYPFIYRKWKQGWPRYRKMLTASIKRMAIGKCNGTETPDILDDTDETEITENVGLPPWLGIRYLTDNYFRGKNFRNRLYWGGIDLKTFYPTIKTDVLANDLIRLASVKQEAAKQLIHTMFDFDVDYSGYSDHELKDMGFEDGKSIGLPTGLIVGGWLANVYLLEIDNKIESKLKTNNKVIHFRYVDDHTFVAETFEILIDWMHEYWLLLKERNLKINFDKIQPTLPDSYSTLFARLIEDGWECIENEEIKEILDKNELRNKEEILKRIGEYCSIDPIYPSPLMTLTLQKVSQISHLSLNLLSKSENELIFHDLKSLITVDLPDAEIKKETRISFASTMLSRMLMSNTIDLDKIRDLRESFIESCQKEKQSIEEVDRNKYISVLSEVFDNLGKESDNELNDTFPKLDWQSLAEVRRHINASRKDSSRRANKIFYLLRRALDEAPDKVNIWIRTMEFCIRHTPTHIPELFNHLDGISDKTLHRLGVIFIRRQLLSLCTTRFIKAVWKQYGCQTTKQDFNEIESQFISELLQLPERDDAYYFNYGTAKLLELAKSFQNLVIDGDGSRIDAYMNDGGYHDVAFSLIHLINLAEHRISQKVIFDVVKSMLSYVNHSDSYMKPLMITLVDICRDIKGDELKNLEDLITSSDSEIAKNAFDCAFRSYSGSDDNDEWISIRDLLRSNEWQNGDFAKSEYVCVKILCDILYYISGTDEIVNKLSSSYFTTSNLFLKKENIQKYDWHDIISDKKNFSVLYNPDNESELLKTLNKAPVMRTAEYENRIIFGLGTVFFHLLCGRHNDEWQKLFKETGYSWRYRINKLCDSGRISTASKRILCGCLLPYVWESRRINGTVSARNETIAIKKLTDLKSRLNKLKETLRHNIVLKSLDTRSIMDPNSSDNLDKTAYRMVEFKIIEVD